MNTIREAKRKLPLPDLMAMLGYGQAAQRQCQCPFHDDENPSFSVFQKEDRWGWKCHAGCGEGDEIDFVAKVKGLSKSAVSLEFLALAGNGASSDALPDEADSEQPVEPQHGSFDEQAWRGCVEGLTGEHLEKIAAQRGYSVEFCAELKFARHIGFADGAVAFPIHDENGVVVGMHCKSKLGTGQWYVAGGCSTFPLVIGDMDKASRVFAFESQWDAFAVMEKLDGQANEMHDTAVVVTRGAGNGHRLAGRIPAGCKLYAFKQNDATADNGNNPADKWLADVVAALPNCEVASVVVPLVHKDANDWTRAGASASEIVTAIAQAKSVVAPQRSDSGVTMTEIADDGLPAGSAGNGRAAPRDPLKDKREKILLPSDNMLLSEFAKKIGKVCANADLFNRGGLVFSLSEHTDGLKPMAPDSFRTWIEERVMCYRLVGEDKTTVAFRTMSQADAGGVLAAQQFLRQLKPLRRLNLVRLPVMRPDERIELLADGYDRQSQIQTLTHGLAYDTAMSGEEAKETLEDLFGEFRFTDDGRSKSVAVAAMLTLFAGGLLPHKSLVPCFVIIANAEGAGKTMLAKIILMPVLGICTLGTKPGNEEEIRKALLCSVMEARPALVFDNCSGHLSSSSLEGFLTSTDWSDRVLGSSKTFTGEKVTTAFVTGNACTVSPDIRRRSLFCELFMAEDRAEERQFRRTLENADLMTMRPKVLAALWALVRKWDQGGRPKSSLPYSTCPRWAEIIGGIVEHAGYVSPVQPAILHTAGDNQGDEMRRLVAAIAGGAQFKRVTFADLVSIARTNGLFERLLGADGTVELDRKVRTTFSRILTSYKDRLIGGYRFKVDGDGHARRYVVETLNAPPAHAQEHEPHDNPY